MARVIKAQLFFSFFSLSFSHTFFIQLLVLFMKWVVISLLTLYITKLSLPFYVLGSIQVNRYCSWSSLNLEFVHRLAMGSILKAVKLSVKSYLSSKESMRGKTFKVKKYIYVAFYVYPALSAFSVFLAKLFENLTLEQKKIRLV